MIEKLIIPATLILAAGVNENNIVNYNDFIKNSAEKTAIGKIGENKLNIINEIPDAVKPTRDEIMQTVTDIIVEQLGVARNIVKPNTSYTDDLGADSLDVVELIMEFEKTFCIAIPDDIAEKIETVSQSVDYIYQKVNDLPTVFYSDNNFSGKKEPFYCDGGYFEFKDPKLFNSIIIPKGYIVVLYSEKAYGGISVKIDATATEVRIKSVNKIELGKNVVASDKILGNFEIKSFKVEKI